MVSIALNGKKCTSGQRHRFVDYATWVTRVDSSCVEHNDCAAKMGYKQDRLFLHSQNCYVDEKHELSTVWLPRQTNLSRSMEINIIVKLFFQTNVVIDIYNIFTPPARYIKHTHKF